MNKGQLYNSGWIIAEKIVSLIGLFLVTSFVAKYIGFGKLALATASFQIIQIAAQMGSDNIIFKRTSKNRCSGLRLIRATLAPRALIYFSLSLPVILWFISGGDKLAIWFCFSSFLASFFSSLDVYAIYNNALLLSKINAFFNIIGLVVSLLIRYAVAFFQLSPTCLFLPIILVTLIPLILRLLYLRHLPVANVRKKHRKIYTRYLIRSGMALVISSLSVAIYTRISILMLAWQTNDTAVGLFTAASTLANAWIFITSALITSSYTAIFNCKKEEEAQEKAIKINRIVIFISLFFITITLLFGKNLLLKLYGEEYINAWPAMKVLAFSAFFSASGPIAYRYIIRLSGFSYLSKKMLLLLLLQLPVSWLLTGYFGLTGAAVSVLLVEFISLTLMNYFFCSGVIAKIHFNSLHFLYGRKNEKIH